MFGDQLRGIAADLHLIGFEMVLAIGALVVLMAGLLMNRPLILKGMFGTFLLISLIFIPSPAETTLAFDDVLTFDALSLVIRFLIGVTAFTIVFFPSIRSRDAEFYFLVLSIVIGSGFMLSANHLLVIYLAVELTSFAAYIITCFNFEKRSFEAGMKYLLFGGVSSAIALYGASLIYGFTGTLHLHEMISVLPGGHPDLLNFALLAFVGGLFFKISLVPFHIWVPSAYQEGPTEAVAVLSTVPKIAAFVLLHRVLGIEIFQEVEWLISTIGFLGIATIVLGTLGAMRQTNAKRLIAYGAIAHSGFLFAALLIPGQAGGNAFVWYSIVYTIMSVAAFYLLAVFEVRDIREVQGFTGMGKKEPFLGGLFTVVLIALVGLPPTAGFTVKFYLFSGMWMAHQSTGSPSMLLYLFVAVLSVVFSLVYYLKIPFYYFLRDQKNAAGFRSNFMQRMAATIFVGVLLWMFFSAEILNNIADSINFIDW